MPISTAPIWESGSWESLPPLDRDIRTQVCVVGLGGAGLSAITVLAEEGVDVIGIDGGSVAGSAAGKNGGLLLAGTSLFYHTAIATFGHEYALSMYRRTMQEIVRMAEETPEAIRMGGSLRIASNNDELRDIEIQYETLRQDDLPVERYEGPEGVGIVIPTDGVFNPLLRNRTLAKRLLERGVPLFERTVAVAIEPGRITTPNARITCDQIIVSVDGKLGKLFPELVPRIRDVRLQMLATAPTAGVSFSRPVYTRMGYDYWQQLPDGCLAIGGCRDIGGDDEYTSDTTVSDKVQQALEQLLRERLKVTAPITNRWAAIVSYTNDHKPICEQVMKNVWALGGYCGTGNVIGPMLGREVARSLIEKSR